MVGALARFFTSIVNKYLPNPFLFAILLTVLTFILGVAMTPNSPLDMVIMWGDGFWNLLAFAMQMCLVIVTGHALASSGPVKRGMTSLASMAKTPAQGVMLVGFCAAIACVINWGFGLVVGAMFAREVARRVPTSDYRLLIATAYMGFLSWHGGLSGSVPLVAATAGNPMEKLVGLIPISETLFTPYNIFITVGLIFLVPVMARMMMPKEHEIVAVDPALLKEDATIAKVLGPDATWAEKIEESQILAWIVGLLGIIYLGSYFAQKGLDLNINTVN